MDRVSIAIARAEKKIADRIASGATTPEKVESAGLALDMDVHEYYRFQELKSLAVAEGKLSQEEAQTVYGLIGNSPRTFNRLPVAAKSVLNTLFAELLR